MKFRKERRGKTILKEGGSNGTLGWLREEGCDNEAWGFLTVKRGDLFLVTRRMNVRLHPLDRGRGRGNLPDESAAPITDAGREGGTLDRWGQRCSRQESVHQMDRGVKPQLQASECPSRRSLQDLKTVAAIVGITKWIRPEGG